MQIKRFSLSKIFIKTITYNVYFSFKKKKYLFIQSPSIDVSQRPDNIPIYPSKDDRLWENIN